MTTLHTNDEWLEQLAETTNPEPVEVEVRSFAPQYEFPDLWVCDWLLKYAAPRSTYGQFHWCQEWYEHPDIGARIAALWMAWEHDFAEPDPDSDENNSIFESLPRRNHWWVYHYANQEQYIFGDFSSMRRCTPAEHKPIQPPFQAKIRPELETKSEPWVAQ